MALLLAVIFAIFFPIFTLVAPQEISVPGFLLEYCLNDIGNYINNSDYQANLNHVFSTLPAGNGNGYGFYNLSYGGDGKAGDIDKVYAIGQCRGDVKPDVCRDCLKNATIRVLQVCPEQKNGGGWYEYCMLRFSNRSMVGGAAPSPTKLFVRTSQNASNQETFKKDLGALLNRLKNQAAGGGSLRKFATGNTTSDFTSIYALVQCTTDLSQNDCNNCLDNAFQDIPSCCDGVVSGRIIQSNCNFRFDDFRFYDDVEDVEDPSLFASPPSTPPSPPPTTTQGSQSNSRIAVIVGVSSAVIGLVLMVLLCVFLKIRRKNNVETHHSYNQTEVTETPESLQYNFETIRIATDNFSEVNKLGQGGFGPVYKGTLSNGKDVAVKRLSGGSSQGDLEFKTEVTLVAKLQHRNLVRIVGFCIQGSERLLIYELVANGSLEHFIFDPIKRANLDWNRRYKIIGGVARGLLYLHEDSRLRIIHRDLKASNILLDEDINPKISDFGMARIFHVDQTHGTTKRVVGTYGYMAPEYAMHGQFSVKSDVYSFGVLVLEIVTGQKNNKFNLGDQVDDLLSSAWKNWKNGTATNIVDELARQGPGSEIIRCIHIALLCVQENVGNRPTMSSVALMLGSNSLSLPMPTEPGFFIRHNNNNDNGRNLPLYLSSREFDSDNSQCEPPRRNPNEASIQGSVNEASIQGSVNESSIQGSVNEASITEPYPR